jgi:hypothetical protein
LSFYIIEMMFARGPERSRSLSFNGLSSEETEAVRDAWFTYASIQQNSLSTKNGLLGAVSTEAAPAVPGD